MAVVVDELEKMYSTNPKVSDWVESLPIELFGFGHPKMVYKDTTEYCGMGIIAEFFGIDWENYPHYSPFGFPTVWLTSDSVKSFIYDKIGENFGWLHYDSIQRHEGRQAAKDFTVDWLRDRGL